MEIDAVYDESRRSTRHPNLSTKALGIGETRTEDWPLTMGAAINPDLVVQNKQRPVFQKSTLLPFLVAFALTFCPAVALLTYILVFPVATVSDCKNIQGVCNISQRTVLISEPVQRFLTVTKVVDTVQQLATVWTLSLAAFIVADTWLRSPDNPLTSKTLALVVSMYASGRWWTLYDSGLSVYRKTARLSRPFMQALVILLATLMLSRAATVVDFWLHYVSKEMTVAVGEAVPVTGTAGQYMFSRSPNTTCWDTGTAQASISAGVPCTINPGSQVSDRLMWPGLSASLAVNQSTSDSVVLLYDVDSTTGNQTTTAIVSPPVSGETGISYNASTIGVSGYCESLTTICNLFLTPRSGGSYNCSTIGEPGFSDSLELGSVILGASNIYRPARFVNGTIPGQATTSYYLLGLTSANVSDYDYFTGLNPTSLTLARCSVNAFRINYTATHPINGVAQYTIMQRTPTNKNESDTVLAPFLTTSAYVGDAVAASKGSAQISGKAFIQTLGQEIVRSTLIYAAGSWTSTEAVSVAQLPVYKQYTQIPLAPLALFFAFVFIYSLFIIFIFILTTRTGRTTITSSTKLRTDGIVTVTDLAQRRLVRTDFLLHQLLSNDERKSTVTDADKIFKGEEDTPVSIGIHDQGRFGVYASGEESPTVINRRASTFNKRSGTFHSLTP